MGSSITCNFVAFPEKPIVEDAWDQVTTPISLFFTYLGGGNAWDPVSLAISVLFVKNRRGDAWDQVTTQISLFFHDWGRLGSSNHSDVFVFYIIKRGQRMGSSITCNFAAFLEKPMVEDAWDQVTTPASLFFTYLGGGNAWDPVSLAISVLS